MKLIRHTHNYIVWVLCSDYTRHCIVFSLHTCWWLLCFIYVLVVYYRENSLTLETKKVYLYLYSIFSSQWKIFAINKNISFKLLIILYKNTTSLIFGYRFSSQESNRNRWYFLHHICIMHSNICLQFPLKAAIEDGISWPRVCFPN